MNNSITNRQIAFILFGVIVGFGVLGLPKTVAENAGTGGWIALLIAAMITAMFAYIITRIGYEYENKTLFEYSEIIVGKYASRIFIGIYIVYYFLIATMIGRLCSEVIKLTILLKTPKWTILLLFLSVVYYAIRNGLVVIARICEIYGAIIIMGSLFIYFLIFTQGELVNIQPFFNFQDLGSYIKATTKLIIPFLGIESVFFIPINKKMNKKVFKHVVLMIVFIGVFYIIISEACISVIGVDDIVHYQDALMAAIRRVDIHYLEMFRRLDGLFLNIWIISVFCTICIELYGASLFISKFTKKISFNTITLIVTIMSFIVALIPEKAYKVNVVVTYIGYLGVFPAMIMPIILIIGMKVKKHDKKS